jgi:hypothetical protein
MHKNKMPIFYKAGSMMMQRLLVIAMNNQWYPINGRSKQSNISLHVSYRAQIVVWLEE